jgi:hypothetical protein
MRRWRTSHAPLSPMREDVLIVELASMMGNPSVRSKLTETLARVEGVLAASEKRPQAWEPVSLTLFGPALPGIIKSCWVFVLRAGATFGAERHPNSHQRTVALRGSALFEVLPKDSWLPRPIDAASPDPVNGRWLSIPANTWHRIKVGPQNLVSCSFHTVPANELIEETPVAEDLSVTLKKLYHA